MIAIAVYDKIIYKDNPNPDYPKIKKHLFSKVWVFNEDGSLKKPYTNVTSSTNARVEKEFKLENKMVYLITATTIDGNEFKRPRAINRCSIINHVNGEFRIYQPSKCQGLILKKDYPNNKYLVNDFLNMQFRNQNVCDFTKYILMSISDKEGFGLEKKIDALSPHRFSLNNYVQSVICNHYRKLEKKDKKERDKNSVVQTSLFADVQEFSGEDDEYEQEYNNENNIEMKEGNLGLEDILKISDEYYDGNKSERVKIKVETETEEVIDETPEVKEVVEAKSDKEIKSRTWSEEDVNFLLDNRHLLNLEQLAKSLNRKIESVRDKFYALLNSGKISNRGYVGTSKKSPSDESKLEVVKELIFFRKQNKLSQKDVADLLDVDDSTISLYERDKRLPSKNMYHKIIYLIKNYEEMADVVERSGIVEVVKIEKLKSTGIKKTNSTWTEEEEQFLIDNYYKKGSKYCAKELGRSAKSVMCKVERLKSRGVEFVTKEGKKVVSKKPQEDATKVLEEKIAKLEEEKRKTDELNSKLKKELEEKSVEVSEAPVEKKKKGFWFWTWK